MSKTDTLTKARIVEAVVETNGYTQKKAFETVEIMLELIKRSLESGHDGNLAVCHGRDHGAAINVENARGTVRVTCEHRHLPAGPGPSLQPHGLQYDGQQTGSNLFAGRDHRVMFLHVRGNSVGSTAGRCLIDPADQLVGCARHRRHNNRNFMPGGYFTRDMACNIADPFNIGDGRSTKFQYQPAQGPPAFSQQNRSYRVALSPAQQPFEHRLVGNRHLTCETHTRKHRHCAILTYCATNMSTS